MVAGEGSPPRMRGKRAFLDDFAILNRITPADAGKTPVADARAVRAWDHPRGCGENSLFLRYTDGADGSPPRMRGKLSIYDVIETINRITPADAGKTFSCDAVVGAAQDHPRGCGENLPSVSEPQIGTGSPPRMRGKLVWSGFWAASDGITPADAGKTGGCFYKILEGKDHPRGCGENACGSLWMPSGRGSPPRMRGKLLKRIEKAGRTWDHPRGCGENEYILLAICLGQGSPPRMRGKLSSIYNLPHQRWDHPRGCGENRSCQKPNQAPTRITPADAGKTAAAEMEPYNNRDHPRGCGENYPGTVYGTFLAGSPPRMRGKLCVLRQKCA